MSYRIIIGTTTAITRPDRPQALSLARLLRLIGVDVRIEPVVMPTRYRFTPAEDCASKANILAMQDRYKLSRPGF